MMLSRLSLKMKFILSRISFTSLHFVSAGLFAFRNCRSSVLYGILPWKISVGDHFSESW